MWEPVTNVLLWTMQETSRFVSAVSVTVQRAITAAVHSAKLSHNMTANRLQLCLQKR